MTGIGSKLQAAGYSTNFFGALASLSPSRAYGRFTFSAQVHSVLSPLLQASGMLALLHPTTRHVVVAGITRSFTLTEPTVTRGRAAGAAKLIAPLLQLQIIRLLDVHRWGVRKAERRKHHRPVGH